MPRKGPFELHVDDIEYYLNSIRSTFMDGSSLVDMASQLKREQISVQDVGYLFVRRLRGQWYVLKGNRRLFVLKKMKEFGLFDGVIAVRFYKGAKGGTYREGEKLRLRGRHDFGAEIDALFKIGDGEGSEDSGYGRIQGRQVFSLIND